MSTNLCHTKFESPIGQIVIEGDEGSVTGLYLPGHKGWNGPAEGSRPSDQCFTNVRGQLEQYFAGERQTFDVPLKSAGTPFQERVWQALRAIPYGRTMTYAQLAGCVGQPAASRAVGAANGRNPISILVPCHRVVGANGRLTGYAGGLDAKQWLLEWEASHASIER